MILHFFGMIYANIYLNIVVVFNENLENTHQNPY